MIATQGAAAGETALVDIAKRYIAEKYDKPGNVYLGVVSRLDAHVTGVVVLARTSKSAARLNRQFQQREVSKRYLAVVAGETLPRQGKWTDFVRKNEPQHRMQTCRADDEAAREAITRFRRLNTLGNLQLLELQPVTGRKHQLRVQLASRGRCIVGDRKYGSVEKFASGIALHARWLQLEHPVRREKFEFEAPLPVSWQTFGKLIER